MQTVSNKMFTVYYLAYSSSGPKYYCLYFTNVEAEMWRCLLYTLLTITQISKCWRLHFNSNYIA